MKELKDYLYYHEEGPPEINIYLGDCLEIIPLLPKIDLTVTSPPYDQLREYEGINTDININKLSAELHDITVKGGVCVWVVGDQTIYGSESLTSFKQAIQFNQNGFNLHDTMIYEKPSCPFPETVRYYQTFEYMFIFSAGSPKTVNLIQDRKNIYAGSPIARLNGDRQADGQMTTNSAYRIAKDRKTKEIGVRFNVWRYATSASEGNHLKTKHPATFPDRLAKDHIISWSNQADVVLDPFLGSGTTLVACKELKRNGIGIEINQKYAQIAVKRLQNTQVPFL